MNPYFVLFNFRVLNLYLICESNFLPVVIAIMLTEESNTLSQLLFSYLPSALEMAYCFHYPSKQMRIVTATTDHLGKILDLYFAQILTKFPGVSGGYPNGVPLKIKDDIIKHLKQGLSLVAIDEMKNEIIGFSVNHIIERYSLDK